MKRLILAHSFECFHLLLIVLTALYGNCSHCFVWYHGLCDLLDSFASEDHANSSSLRVSKDVCKQNIYAKLLTRIKQNDMYY